MSADPVYAFGDFRIDIATRRLVRSDGAAVTLPNRLFDCVAHLIEHRGRAVGRDELIAVIWGREDAGDNLLGQLIVRARRLLDDSGDQQEVIRTLPGFGYQWVAPTQRIEPGRTVAASPRALPSAVADTAASATARPRWRVHAGLVATAVLVIGAGAWLRPAPAPPPPADEAAQAVVASAAMPRPDLVLPAILVADAAQDWLRLGVMALVGERLAEAGQAVVPSDNAAALTRGLAIDELAPADHARLAAAAAAGRVVSTRIEPAGAGWRVRLAVVYGAEPLEVAAEAGQVLDAARDAADRLAARLVPSPPSAPVPARDAALDFVLKKAEAIFLGGRPDAAADLLMAARDAHPDAPELDIQLAAMAFRAGRFEQAEAGFAALAERAAVQDAPVLRARALIGLANLALVRRDTEAVLQRSQQAIDLLESADAGAAALGSAYHGRAIAASLQGRYEAAFADYARAQEIHAGAGNWLDAARVDSNFGIALRQQGRVEEALPRLQRTADRLALFQAVDDEIVARVHLATTLLDLADPVSALAEDGRLAALAERSRWPHLRTSIELARAEVLIANGRLRDAQPLLERGGQGATDGPLPNRYRVHSIAARYAWSRGESGLTRREIDQALGVLCEADACATGDGRDLAYLHLLRARAVLPGDRPAAVAIRAQLARRLAEPAYATVYLHLIDADLAIAAGDAAAADRAFEAASAVTGAIPIDRERIAEAYVPWLMAHGAIDRAGGVLAALGPLPQRSFTAALLELRVLRALGRPAAWRRSLDRVIRLAGERDVPEELRRPDFLALSGAAS